VISTSMRQAVRSRAREICEYCLAPEIIYNVTFHVEHIVPRQHGGETTLSNLALSCHLCNRYKGPNLSGIDPQSATLARLFHPRNDGWRDHFDLVRGVIVGRTPIGRATVQVLNMNMPDRVRTREVAGVLPPI
jgi:hypothetical protein